jgi:hypothetical protein
MDEIFVVFPPLEFVFTSPKADNLRIAIRQSIQQHLL